MEHCRFLRSRAFHIVSELILALFTIPICILCLLSFYMVKGKNHSRHIGHIVHHTYIYSILCIENLKGTLAVNNVLLPKKINRLIVAKRFGTIIKISAYYRRKSISLYFGKYHSRSSTSNSNLSTW